MVTFKFKSVEIILRILSFYGLMESKISKTKCSSFHQLCTHTLQILFTYLMVFTQILFVYQLTQTGTTLEVTISIAILFSLIFVSYKVIFYRLMKSKIFTIQREIQNLSETLSLRLNVKEWDKRLIRDFCLYIGSIYVAIVASVCVAVISFKDKKLGYDIWVPFDYHDSDLKQILSIAFATFLAMHNMTLAYTIDFHVISILGIGKGAVLDKIDDFKIGKKDLKSMIEFLQNFQILFRRINEEITLTFLPQVVLMSVILCFGSYGLILVSL